MQEGTAATLLLVNGSLLRPQLLRQLLRHIARMPCEVEQVPSIAAARNQLINRRITLMLVCTLDITLGIELETLISDYRDYTTIVLISSTAAKTLRTQARAAGATTVFGVLGVLGPSDFRSSLIEALLQAALQIDRQRHQQATALMEQHAFEQLRTVIAQLAHGVIVVDQEGRMQFMNTAAEQLFDRNAVEMQGKVVGFPVVVGESAEIDVVRHNDLLSVEMRVARTEWDGQVAAIISLRDFTERRKLHEAEAFSHAIFNSLTTPICVVDEQGTILAVNDAWMASPQDVGQMYQSAIGIGTNYFSVCQQSIGSDEEDDAIAVIAGIQSVLRGELSVFELEYSSHSATTERWFLMRVVPLIGEQHKRLVISRNDITAQKLAARATTEATMLLNQLRQQKHELAMIARMSSSLPTQLQSQYLRLRDHNPVEFARWVQYYGAILDQAIEQHFHQTKDDQHDTTRELAIQMGQCYASPRDIIDVHLTSMRMKSSGVPLNKAQAYLEEGRVTVLAVMGHLAAYYRRYRRSASFAGFRIRRSRHQTGG